MEEENLIKEIENEKSYMTKQCDIFTALIML